jgi:hypothetical protein
VRNHGRAPGGVVCSVAIHFFATPASMAGPCGPAAATPDFRCPARTQEPPPSAQGQGDAKIGATGTRGGGGAARARSACRGAEYVWGRTWRNARAAADRGCSSGASQLMSWDSTAWDVVLGGDW